MSILSGKTDPMEQVHIEGNENQALRPGGKLGRGFVLTRTPQKGGYVYV
jgi:hypothetical protein